MIGDRCRCPTDPPQALAQAVWGCIMRKVTNAPGGAQFSSDESAALEHAWDWFSLHATQRMHLINYLLISLALVTAGYATAVNSGTPRVASGIAVAGVVISLTFWRLDVRTRHLVQAAEVPIQELESRLGLAANVTGLDLSRRVQHTGMLGSYTSLIRVLSLTAAGICLLGAIFGLTIDPTGGPNPAPTPPRHRPCSEFRCWEEHPGHRGAPKGAPAGQARLGSAQQIGVI